MKVLPYSFILLCLAGCSNGVGDNKLDASSINSGRATPQLSALTYVGLHERTHRKQLRQLVGVDPVRTEWCAAFVNAVLKESGIPGSETVSDNPLMARSFLDWGSNVKKPLPGDIVVFPRGREGWKGHVGFFLKSQIIDGIEYYYILGGNQNNRVSVELYPARRALGIRRYTTPI